MQKSIESSSKSIIRRALGKNPSLDFSEFEAAIGEFENKELSKSQFNCILKLLEEVSRMHDARQKLSRQIGPAKKRNEDCEALIAEVAGLTAKINALNTQIDGYISDLTDSLVHDKDSCDKDVCLQPQHLRLDESFIKHEDHDGCGGKFETSHTESIKLSEWQAFIENSFHSNIYHDAVWWEIIESNFGHKSYCITCRDQSGRLKGVLPLCHLKSMLFGSFTVSMPFFNYGGPLAVSDIAEEALLSHAARLTEELGCSHMEIRDVRSRKNWISVQRKVSMILPLPDTDTELDANLGSKIRAQVKKAESNGLRVCFGGVDLVDHFYEVFSRNMRDLGTPVYGKKLFVDTLAKFPEAAFIAMVYRGDTPLAASFLIGYRDKLEIPWASSIRSENHLGSNMFMYRSVLSEAISRKYKYFDFGRSTTGSSTFSFKKQWGAKQHPLYWHYWTRGGADAPQINPDNPKYKLVISIWQKLPVFVTRIIGPLIAKNLP